MRRSDGGGSGGGGGGGGGDVACETNNLTCQSGMLNTCNHGRGKTWGGRPLVGKRRRQEGEGGGERIRGEGRKRVAGTSERDERLR